MPRWRISAVTNSRHLAAGRFDRRPRRFRRSDHAGTRRAKRLSGAGGGPVSRFAARERCRTPSPERIEGAAAVGPDDLRRKPRASGRKFPASGMPRTPGLSIFLFQQSSGISRRGEQGSADRTANSPAERIRDCPLPLGPDDLGRSMPRLWRLAASAGGALSGSRRRPARLPVPPSCQRPDFFSASATSGGMYFSSCLARTLVAANTPSGRSRPSATTPWPSRNRSGNAPL